MKGYILISELTKKTGVASSLWRQLNNLVFEKMGNATIVKVDSLPEKYKEVAKACTDLEKYITFSELSRKLGMCDDYIACTEVWREKKFKKKKIGKFNLFELTDEFVKLENEGLTPFILNGETQQYAEYGIEMQGLKIGFY